MKVTKESKLDISKFKHEVMQRELTKDTKNILNLDSTIKDKQFEFPLKYRGYYKYLDCLVRTNYLHYLISIKSFVRENSSKCLRDLRLKERLYQDQHSPNSTQKIVLYKTLDPNFKPLFEQSGVKMIEYEKPIEIPADWIESVELYGKGLYNPQPHKFETKVEGSKPNHLILTDDLERKFDLNILNWDLKLIEEKSDVEVKGG